MSGDADLLVIPLTPSIISEGLFGVETMPLQSGPMTGLALHRHDMGQIFSLAAGLCVIEHATERVSVPPGRIGWIPPGVPHAALNHGDIAGWAAYLDPRLCGMLPPRPCALECSPLVPPIMERLLALAGHADIRNGPAASESPGRTVLSEAAIRARKRRLVAVLLDELGEVSPVLTHLPFPRDARFSPVVQALINDPSDARQVREWARLAMMSERTFSRLFSRETGMTFDRWRRRVRLMRGRELLAEGVPVKEAAWGVGYENVSAFIAGFRSIFGTTPGRVAKQKAGGTA
ncbi:MAG: AraC family transcriptional regulator [Desulfovibrio sp.]|nr:AraC family transcriptional regulator [Desulfovibrio sp.]